MIDFVVGLITGIPMSSVLIATGVFIVVGILDRTLRTYVTYILTNPETSLLYIGRTSGYGEIESIVRKRLYGHKYYKQGFTEITVDKAMQGRIGRLAIRGREQQLIDSYGGIGHPQVANIIRAVSIINPRRNTFNRFSNEYFDKLAD